MLTLAWRNAENFEWLGRQARSGIESGTYHLPVLRAEPPTAGGGNLSEEKFINLENLL